MFTTKAPDGTAISKTFTFKPSSYVFSIDVKASGGPALSQLGVSMSQPLTAHQGYYDIPELQADVSDKVITENEKKLKALKPEESTRSGPITYAGFGDQYFLSVFLPQQPTSGTLSMAFAGDEAIARLLFDGAAQVHSEIYMGPKLLEALDAVNPALHKAIDFGWAGILALIFLRTLKLFHYIAPNYGVDIILLTVSIRIAFLPISIRSQRSMMKMQRLAPQIERLREKYKDNNEQLQKEMVDFYKRNHVNPLGGCAPMALQLPIFIGLYEALLNSVELRHAPFVGWINDLSTPDCLHVPGMPQLPLMHCHGLPVLVLLMGLTSFLQQYMTPTTPDPESAADDDADAGDFHDNADKLSRGTGFVLFFVQPARSDSAILSQPRIPTIHAGHMSNMDSIEVEAASVEEATREALEQLGAREDEATVEVLATPRSGVLGLGARNARVRVTRQAGGSAGANHPAAKERPRHGRRNHRAGQARRLRRGLAGEKINVAAAAMAVAGADRINKLAQSTTTAARQDAGARKSRSSASRRWRSSSRFSRRWASRPTCGRWKSTRRRSRSR